MSDTPTTTDLELLAGELITALQTYPGVRADRYPSGPDSAGVNVWLPEAHRGPSATVVLSDSGRFHDYAWGHQWQHVRHITETPTVVARAIMATLVAGDL